PIGRREDVHRGRGVDDDRQRGARLLAAAVGDRRPDRVRAGREGARGERTARAERPVAAGGPGDAGGEVAVLGVGGRGGGGDGDGRRGVDDDGERGAGRLAARVGDRRGDGVGAGAERGRRDRPARAERTVPARAPRDVGGQVAVLEVGGGGREGDRGPREIAGPTRRGRDAHNRAAVDRDRDRRGRRAVA